MLFTCHQILYVQENTFKSNNYDKQLVKDQNLKQNHRQSNNVSGVNAPVHYNTARNNTKMYVKTSIVNLVHRNER